MRALSSPYFLVKITDAAAAPNYSFVEVWRSGGSVVQKIGGRYGDKVTQPGVAVDGSVFTNGALAYCRGADGDGGLTWELSSTGSGAALASPLTTKGDIWGYDTTDDRVPVGADGDVLTADSTAALGVSYQPVVTSISTLNATGGPLTGDIALKGGTNTKLAVAGNVITINGPTFAAGTGITITVAGSTLTFAATGGGGSPLTTLGDVYVKGLGGSPPTLQDVRLPVSATDHLYLGSDSTDATYGLSYQGGRQLWTPTAAGFISFGGGGASGHYVVLGRMVAFGLILSSPTLSAPVGNQSIVNGLPFGPTNSEFWACAVSAEDLSGAPITTITANVGWVSSQVSVNIFRTVGGTVTYGTVYISGFYFF